MSTKTTIKRIALVAAVAAAFGGLSTVAANATASTAGATVTVSGDSRVSLGDKATFTVSTAFTGTPVTGDTITVTPTIAFTPATSGASATGLAVAADLQGTSATAGTASGVSPSTSVAGVVTYTALSTAVSGSGDSFTYVTAAPTVAGTYTITFTPTGSGAGVYIPAVYTLVAGTSSSATLAGTGTSSVSGQSNAVTGSDIADGSHFATVKVFAGTADNAYVVNSTGAGSLYGLVTPSTNLGGSTYDAREIIYNNGASVAVGFAVGASTAGVATVSTTHFAAGEYFSFVATSSAAGTQVITVTPVNGTSAATTITITWGSAPVVSAQYSTAYEALTTATASSTSDALGIQATKSATTQVGNIQVVLNSAASTPITGQGLAVSISGPGLIGLYNNSTAANAAVGRSLSIAAAVGNLSTFSIPVWADGTSGISTITITSGSTTIATKTVTFYGSPAKATATQALYVAKAGQALGANPSTYLLEGAVVGNGVVDPLADSAKSGTAAITGTVVDSNGNAVAGATVKLVSSNSAVITAGTCDEVTAGTYAAPGTFQCQVSGASGALSGQSATVTFEVYDATTAAYDITAAPLTFTIGGAITKETLVTDASSYASLAPIVLTVKATDASGNPAYDQDGTLVASLVSSTQLGGTLASPVELVKGVGTEKGLYAPAVAGDFTISGLDNVSAAGEAVSVTATSNGGSADAQASAATDAANEATDAANAATDAANAAADAADAATQAAQDASAQAQAALAAVNALSAKITVLAAQIAKIVKKLKA